MRGSVWREAIGCVEVRPGRGLGSAGTDDSVGLGGITGGLALGGGAARVGATASAVGAVEVAGPLGDGLRVGAVGEVFVGRSATGGGTRFSTGIECAFVPSTAVFALVVGAGNCGTGLNAGAEAGAGGLALAGAGGAAGRSGGGGTGRETGRETAFAGAAVTGALGGGGAGREGGRTETGVGVASARCTLMRRRNRPT